MRDARWGRRAWALAVLGVLPFSSAAAAKCYVEPPDVAWESLVPYVRATIVAELDGDEFHVFVCVQHTDRSVVTPFDDALADFTRVLVTQAMRANRKLEKELQALTEGFRRRVPSLSGDERGRYRELFWQSVRESPIVLATLRSVFTSSARRGELRCWLCEHDSSFAPLAKRVQRGR